ncbi:hypothetical protein B9Z55_018623 [Caenorhabditis nigoni]|uniref:Uncharacterized protein n=1 Tax=Caenorhabditis nigoni TaxID=1611254 RepID=A0A2G5TFM8_9PELO|nr:hypothetical protein B9Z55_018623 [Caenorhabditis nigoni]
MTSSKMLTKNDSSTEGYVQQSPASTNRAPKRDNVGTRDVYATNDEDAEKPSKSLVEKILASKERPSELTPIVIIPSRQCEAYDGQS